MSDLGPDGCSRDKSNLRQDSGGVPVETASARESARACRSGATLLHTRTHLRTRVRVRYERYRQREPSPENPTNTLRGYAPNVAAPGSTVGTSVPFAIACLETLGSDASPRGKRLWKHPTPLAVSAAFPSTRTPGCTPSSENGPICRDVRVQRGRERASVESVGHAGEDHPWLEEQQPLDVEGALVVQRAGHPAEHELRHQDTTASRVGVGGDLSEGQAVSGSPMSRKGASRSTSSGQTRLRG